MPSRSLAEQIFNRFNHQARYFTRMVIGCEDTVDQGILPEKGAFLFLV